MHIFVQLVSNYKLKINNLLTGERKVSQQDNKIHPDREIIRHLPEVTVQ